jgi:hypothetical protein
LLILWNDSEEYFSQRAVDNLADALAHLGIAERFESRTLKINNPWVKSQVENGQYDGQYLSGEAFFQAVDKVLEASAERLCEIALIVATRLVREQWAGNISEERKAEIFKSALAFAAQSVESDLEDVAKLAVEAAIHKAEDEREPVSGQRKSLISEPLNPANKVSTRESNLSPLSRRSAPENNADLSAPSYTQGGTAALSQAIERFGVGDIKIPDFTLDHRAVKRLLDESTFDVQTAKSNFAGGG